MVTKRPDHMHTVPAGYLRAFADASAQRQKPHVWQFERAGGDGRLISVRDAAVSRGIYTLRTEVGNPDTTIETKLLAASVDDPFPPVVRLLSAGGSPEYWQWRDISRFTAFQLARTPRMFQIFRDAGRWRGMALGPNDPPLAMMQQAPFLEKWLCGMRWILCRNRASLPLLTSDNPVVMWADSAATRGFVWLLGLIPSIAGITCFAMWYRKRPRSNLYSPDRLPLHVLPHVLPRPE